jgi:hypothetical protein
MDDAVAIVNHAAAQSDRWLFLAALVAGAIGAALVARWFVCDRSRILTEYKATNELYHASLQRMNEAQAKTIQQLSACLNRNTAALNRCAFELRYARKTKKNHAQEDINGDDLE